MMNAPKRLWAAYVGMSSSQGISLHADERSALIVIAETLGLFTEDEDTGGCTPDDEELRIRIDDHCIEGADDWYVQEVLVP